MTPTAAPETAPAPRRTLRLVFLTVFMDFVGFSLLFPLYPGLLEHYFRSEPDGSLLHSLLAGARHLAGHGNEVAVAALFGGLLGAIFSLLQFLFAPVWGALSDRFGRRPTLLITLSGTALAYVLWAFAGAFWVLVASRVLAGVMAGNISVAQAAAADVTTGKDRAKAMATVGLGVAAGILCGPAMGGIAAHLGAGVTGEPGAMFALNPFSVAAGLSLLMAALNLALAWRSFPETLPAQNRRRESARASVLRLARIGSPDIRRATLVNLCFFSAFAGMESTLTFVALELFNYTPGQNAVMFTFIAVSMGLIQGGVVRRMGHRIGEKRMVIAGLVCGLAAFALIAASRHEAPFFAGLFLFSTAVSLTQPGLAALISMYSDERTQGFHSGVFRSAGALARAVGPLVAALLYFRLGTHSGVYLAGAIATLVPLAIALRLRQPAE